MAHAIQSKSADPFHGYYFDCRTKTIDAQIATGEAGVRVIAPTGHHVATLLLDGVPYPSPSEVDAFLQAVVDGARTGA